MSGDQRELLERYREHLVALAFRHQLIEFDQRGNVVVAQAARAAA